MSHTKACNEEFLRRLVRESRSFDRSDTVRLWENIPEKKQQKILKKKWLPAGVQPIVAALSPLGQIGFVMCTDGVLYGHGVDFPGDKVSLVGLVGFDGNYVLTYEDGSEVQLPQMYFCERWLQEIFRATAQANIGPRREMRYEPNELSLTLPKYSVSRMPEFWLPEEMPPHLRAKLQRAFPDLPEKEVLGFCDDPGHRDFGIVLTKDRILRRDYPGVTEVPFKEMDSLFFSDPENARLCFRESSEKREERKKEGNSSEYANVMSVPKHLMRSVEELVDDQYSNCWWEHMRLFLGTERITHNKAVFVYNVRRRLLDYEQDHSLCPEAGNPKALSLRAAIGLSCGVYEDALFCYEMLRRMPCDVDYLVRWAHAGFMCYFYQPLSVTSVRWMLYYLMHFEGPRFVSQNKFIDKWKTYLHENWKISLIDQRNALAQRFNAVAETNGLHSVPILDGYVLDDCLEKMLKK